MDFPKLRPVQTFPIQHQGQTLIGVRDATGLTEQVAVVPEPVLFMMQLMDGEHSVLDIQAACTRRFGQLIASEKIQQVIDQLDEALILESERFRLHYENLVQEFRNLPTRPSSHSGNGYPEDPGELRKQLDGYFQLETREDSPPSEQNTATLRGILAPHIDFARGGKTYAHAYRRLAARSEADLFVVLGVSHMPMDTLFAATGKDYETPLGLMRTDRDFLELLNSKVGTDLANEEFAHRTEHSVEFQMLMLQYLFDGKPEKTAVPILCGSFHELLERGEKPGEQEEIRRFLDGLNQALEECGRKWCLVGGVDLSHVGEYFGDPRDLTDGFLEEVNRADQEILSHVARIDADAFLESICRNNDRYRVCGIPAIYAILKTLRTGKGTILDYQQCVTQELKNCVTIAAVAFE